MPDEVCKIFEGRLLIDHLSSEHLCNIPYSRLNTNGFKDWRRYLLSLPVNWKGNPPPQLERNHGNLTLGYILAKESARLEEIAYRVNRGELPKAFFDDSEKQHRNLLYKMQVGGGRLTPMLNGNVVFFDEITPGGLIITETEESPQGAFNNWTTPCENSNDFTCKMAIWVNLVKTYEITISSKFEVISQLSVVAENNATKSILDNAIFSNEINVNFFKAKVYEIRSDQSCKNNSSWIYGPTEFSTNKDELKIEYYKKCKPGNNEICNYSNVEIGDNLPTVKFLIEANASFRSGASTYTGGPITPINLCIEWPEKN